LIEAFSSKEDKSKHIVFMGFGTMEERVKESSEKYANIHFQPVVAQDEIIKYTSSADIGLCYILKDFSLSYRYSLPNKFNEYMHSGIPLLTSDTLEYLSQIVKEEKCGWSVASDPKAFIKFLNHLTFEQVNEYKAYTKQFAKTLAWENEELIFIKAYQ
jgi:glycosyltransferase involved in cell wall biosynthesis